jgi:4-hydroxy-3-polyprenylbenzoate decarboxylase
VGYRNLRQCLADLEQVGQLVRLDTQIDAELEAAEIQRRVYASGGPAVWFTNVKDCRFSMVSNLFGTLDRVEYMFRDTLEHVRRLIELKVDAHRLLRQPTRYLRTPWAAWRMLPRRRRSGPVLSNIAAVGDLPQLKSWPDDGGAFVTLPQVYTEHAERPGLMASNLGMYRVQLSGGRYDPDHEIGLHYQLHRSIGVHHEAALRAGCPLRVCVFVGGTPAMTLAAVMPLPEGMSELTFAGALARHRIPMIDRRGKSPEAGAPLPIYAEADFCIVGTIDTEKKLPEGPFGDHLGYYSLTHDFPVLRVARVYHRDNAIWPFTVVGRPPQEDTVFGQFVHELTGPIIPTVIPGVSAVHAVDAAGVHPLLLALGSERYTPYEPLVRPQELLTQASAILGQGQLSLTKYLFIAAQNDAPDLDVHDIPAFLQHVLERTDWRRDVHFHTSTTIDTLDYTSGRLNQGSKVVIAAAGPQRRVLPAEAPGNLRLPDDFARAHVCLPGVLAIEGPAFRSTPDDVEPAIRRFCKEYSADDVINRFPLLVVVDDSEFTARTIDNLLWVAFTRSNPATDIYGIAAKTHQKHWGCEGSLVIDARIKPHHAPPLIEDPGVTKKVDALAARGGPLARYL